MKVILLGTGTSTGIPEVGCRCGLCMSSDKRDHRLRTSALVVTPQGKRILIDCGPDFRQQALHIGLDYVDAILLTHEHYDHVYGLDDLRTIAWRRQVPIYGQPRVLEAVRNRMHYVFGENPYPGTPRLELHELTPGRSVEICGLEVCPIEVMHGSLPILAYRLGDDVAYLTDVKEVSQQSLNALEGVRFMVINALRHSKPHPSHQSLLDVEALLGRMSIRPELAVITHLSHHAPSHTELERLLPNDIRPGYDYASYHVKANEIVQTTFDRQKSPYIYQDCGRIAYAEAWALQHKLFDEILQAKAERRPTESYLLLCEHNPVFTLGKHGDEDNMLMSEEYLKAQGFDWFRVERGGDVTYHGPGQITGYPILDLETFGIGLRAYIEMLEDVVIELIATLGIKGERKAGATGVWIDSHDPAKARKICAIGVRSSRYVTMHGFALNVNNDLAPFSLINPCGFKEGKVTSIAQEVGAEVDFTVIKRLFATMLANRLSALMPNPLDAE